MEDNILLNECTQTINNKIKLHILGVPMNKLGNWLMSVKLSSWHKHCKSSRSSSDDCRVAPSGARASWLTWVMRSPVVCCHLHSPVTIAI